MRAHTGQSQGHDADDELSLKAGKGNLQRKTSGSAAAGAAGSPGSSLTPLVGLPVKDGGGFTFVLDADLAFRVISTPPGSERASGKRLTADDANPKVAAAWSTLAERLQHEHPVVQPATPEAGPTPAPTVAPPEEPSLIATALETVREAASGARDFVHGLFSGVTDGIGGLLSGGSDAAPEKPAAPAQAAPAPVQAPAPAPEGADGVIPPASVDGKQDNLAVAKQLAETLNVPHSWEKENFAAQTAGDPAGMARAKLLMAADTSTLKSVVCSEFTTLTLAKAGWDLAAEYRDLATGLPVGFLNANAKPTKKKPIPAPSFVTYYSVVNIWAADTAAMLAAQSGGAERVTAGSDRAKEIGAEARTEDFLYTTSNSLGDGIAIDEDTEFGAGAVAASLGGKTIERDDRKPGDLQQALNTTNGKTIGSGHSSQVWSVRGPGIAKLGAANCPVLHGTPATPIDELEPGWYEVGGDGLLWEVGPDTDPATVAKLGAAEVQTIDANIGRQADSTAVGGFAKQKAFSEEKGSTAYSDGRLPTSKWFDWAPQPDVPATHLAAVAKKTSKKK